MHLSERFHFSASTSIQTQAASSQIIQNRLGMHARPASMFVRVANKYRADIWVQKDGQRVNGKSILGLMTLAAGQGARIVISAQGADAGKAVQELEKLVQGRFDEE
jgi:phosphocarrier protein HPr